MKTMKRDKKWLRNRDQMKNEKIFNVKMLRNKDGSFHVLGGETMVLERKNQHGGNWVNVDTRDFTTELRNSTIRSF